jgi:hypothetical protein
MKKFLLAVAIAGFAITAQAQTEKARKTESKENQSNNKKDYTAEQRAALATRRMASQLNFSNEQQRQSIEILTVREQARDKFKASKKDETSKSEWKKTRKDSNAKLMSILTPEQKQKWEAIKAEKKANNANKKEKEKESEEEFHNFEE